uniref:Uncharacterized protein n=1 Tax=Leptospira santarosai serovar Arenal str. MAVJ 401 TaxID=1049976 RepID=M6JJG3_9LEPT|nr:hypothetical protein LEP1GSC063_2733 [Leptospira santarosai serovar Arenal str. MAVJ 401]
MKQNVGSLRSKDEQPNSVNASLRIGVQGARVQRAFRWTLVA